jgi:hypothetical protein
MIFTICPALGDVHQLGDGFRLRSTLLFFKGHPTNAAIEGFDCYFLRDVYCDVLQDCPSLDVCLQRFAMSLIACPQLFD